MAIIFELGHILISMFIGWSVARQLYIGNSKKLFSLRRHKCHATWTISSYGTETGSCKEGVFDHCENGYCIPHCKGPTRCGGLCYGNRQKLLQEASEL